jgi:membrane protease YdiL (CAAX protease family)
MTEAPPPAAPVNPSPDGYTRAGAVRNGLAWLVILACTTVLIVQGILSSEEASSEKPTLQPTSTPQLDIMLRLANGVHVAGKDAAGGPALMGLGAGEGDVRRMARAAGPGGEMTAAIILARFGDRESAQRLVDDLATQVADGTVTEDEANAKVRGDLVAALRALDAPGPEALSPEQAERLKTSLGLAGETIVAMATGDEAAQHQLGEHGLVLVAVLGVVVCLGGLFALIGLGVLIAFVVMALLGRLRGAGPSAGVRTPLYAEMFAVWMVAFLGFNRLPRLFLSEHAPGDPPPIPLEWQLALGLLGMALALAVALGYARMRGASARDLAADLGLARPSLADPLWGIVGYAMGVALLLAGLVVTLVLMRVFADEGGGMPSHPVQEWIQGGGGMALVLTFVVASVAAPITEEIVFRGALYRNLRDTFGLLGAFAAAAISTIVTSVIFAAIHPQGLFFIPVLAALAVAFCLMREWRGSIYPGIWAHAINNTLILSLNVLLLRG